MNQSEQIDQVASALAKAQGQIVPAIKDCSNPFFKSKYADLSSIWNACREPLSKNNLSVVQTMDTIDGKLILCTLLLHSSGQWIKSLMPVIATKNDAQGIGSALTYMRRYSLAAMVGITSDDDDDGNSAVSTSYQKKQEVPAKKTTDETLSPDQAKEIQELFLLCSDGYEKNFWIFLKDQFNVSKIESIPKSQYERVKRGILGNIEKQYERVKRETLGNIEKSEKEEHGESF